MQESKNVNIASYALFFITRMTITKTGHFTSMAYNLYITIAMHTRWHIITYKKGIKFPNICFEGPKIRSERKEN